VVNTAAEGDPVVIVHDLQESTVRLTTVILF